MNSRCEKAQDRLVQASDNISGLLDELSAYEGLADDIDDFLEHVIDTDHRDLYREDAKALLTKLRNI